MMMLLLLVEVVQPLLKANNWYLRSL